MAGNQGADPRWAGSLSTGWSKCQTVADSLSVPARTLSKHELQYTGRSFRGANGTIAWPPQLPQIAAWNSRGPPAVRACFAAARHAGQRWGSFSRPLLEKNACSPLEKTNSSEQSRQVSDRSSYTLSGASSGVVALDKPPVCLGERRNRTAFQWRAGRGTVLIELPSETLSGRILVPSSAQVHIDSWIRQQIAADIESTSTNRAQSARVPGALMHHAAVAAAHANGAFGAIGTGGLAMASGNPC